MFKVDGNVDVTIIDAYVAECKFPAKENELNDRGEYVQTFYDVVLQLQDEAGNTDLWHGEISNRTGTGNNAHLYRLDLTIKTLQEIGFGVRNLTELESQFVSQPDGSLLVYNLIKMQCTATVVKSEKTDRNGNPYYNVRFLNKLGGGVKKLSMQEIMARRGAPAAQAAPAPAPVAAAPAPAPAAPPVPTAPPPAPTPGAPVPPQTPNCPY